MATNEPTVAQRLAWYRIGFGLIGFLGALRFFLNGWIDEFYVAPAFHFTYAGFDWIEPWPAWGMQLHFAALGVAALFVASGVLYRAATLVYFLLFTYVELLDKTYYLNHYYLVSLIALLLCVVPRGRALLWTLRAQVGLVYFFAGVAKLKGDWLFEAQPLRAWLAANGDAPLIGPLLLEPWVAYAGAWAAAAFDLSVPFLLPMRRTRPWALAGVVVFHLGTAYFFNLGLFPLIMMWNATLFLPTRDEGSPWSLPLPRWGTVALAGHFALQLLLPLRHHFYGNDVTWSEDGFRFAWNVMLIEKAGQVRYRVRDPGQNREWEVLPENYLNARQNEMMATQPDMILQLAQHVRDDFERRGMPGVEVYADAFAALNGGRSARLVDPTVDLARTVDGWGPRAWVLARPTH